MMSTPDPEKERLRKQIKRDIRGVKVEKIKPGVSGLPDNDPDFWHNAAMSTVFRRHRRNTGA